MLRQLEKTVYIYKVTKMQYTMLVNTTKCSVFIRYICDGYIRCFSWLLR